MSLLNIVTKTHTNTKRDYIKRMLDEKIECMKVARYYGKDFWDGERKYGYGGYLYDGRWEKIAEKLIEQYNLKPGARILDVGCGKAFLLYELKKLLPDAIVVGFDISDYAIQNAKEEIKSCLFAHKAEDRYPFKDKEFDLVISLTTLHNLYIYELQRAFKEIERVGKQKYIVVESYRNERELFNLECWALTCRSFFDPKGWEWIFKEFSYTGDYEFIYFE